jgi:GAF domain-containing protein
MARVAAEDVDREIERWLGTTCRVLDLDRSAIYQRAEPTAPVYTTHTWVRPGIPPFPSDYQPSVYLRATAPWVMAGNALIFSDPSEIPPELEDAAKFVAQYGPRASAAIPMRAGKTVIGAASFGRFRSGRKWPSDLVERLALVVQIFASAIERKHSHQKGSGGRSRTPARLAANTRG